MKTLFVILIGAFIISCKPSTKSSKDLAQLKEQSNGLDKCKTIKYKDSTVYKYSHYTIVTIPHNGEVGEKIRIEGEGHSFVLDEGASYFSGIYDNCLIIDEGTGIERGLSLIDLKSEKQIVSFECMAGLDSLNFSNKKMFCYISNIPKEELKRKNVPDCSKNPDAQNYDGGGVLFELIIFDFKSRKTTYTGRFKCS
jgi:hypothetical protein